MTRATDFGQRWTLIPIFAFASLAACSSSVDCDPATQLCGPNEMLDASASTSDAATTTPDAAMQTTDTGTPPPDAGTPSPDAGNATPDAGTVTPDAGTVTPDAGTVTPDAGTVTPDAGAVTPDAGPQTMTGMYVRISAGTFMMGAGNNEPGSADDERPRHTVTITRDFLIKATEVTQAQWRSVMGDNPSSFVSCGDDCPVEQVSWADAAAYVNARSRAEGLQECYPAGDGSGFVGLSCTGYRLPTEAEWEYAARAGTASPYWSGGDEADLERAGWYFENSTSSTQPVAQKEANAWGLYDVHGNVWEWVHGYWEDYASAPSTDPEGAFPGDWRVGRGGSWLNGARSCRAAVHLRFDPRTRSFRLGLRPVRSVQ